MWHFWLPNKETQLSHWVTSYCSSHSVAPNFSVAIHFRFAAVFFKKVLSLMFNIKATGKENPNGTLFHFFLTEFLFVDSPLLIFVFIFPLLLIHIIHPFKTQSWRWNILFRGFEKRTINDKTIFSPIFMCQILPLVLLLIGGRKRWRLLYNYCPFISYSLYYCVMHLIKQQ